MPHVSMTSCPPPACFSRVIALTAFALCLGGGFAYAEEQAKDVIVELPKVVVSDSRELPPPEVWRYASIPGFEILTNASDRETQNLMREFQLFCTGVDVAWRGLQERGRAPVALILCGKGGKFDAFQPRINSELDRARVSLFLKDREQTAIVLDLEAKTVNLSADTVEASAPAPLAAGPGAAAAEPGDPAELTTAREVDHYKLLFREYFRFLMNRAEPRLPAWFEEGLAQLFMGMKVENTRIQFGKLEDSTSGVDADRDFNQAMQEIRFIPLPEFFAVPHDSPVADRPLGNRWAKQCQGLVHMWLFGEGQRYSKGLSEFLIRLQREPVSEQLFEECFKMKYKDMMTVFRGYLSFTNYKSLEWRVPKGQTIPVPAPLVLREATESEVGRIKGDALRLAGFKQAAHTALVAPYIRGERDPRLLAALGLEELEGGNHDRAAKFLEAAVEGKVDRPRAYLELARLQSKKHLAAPAGPNGKLSTAQTRDVVSPLLAARNQPPPLPEIYELMADTLVRSVDTPSRETLQVLLEGANLFPRRVGIAYQTAVLCMRAGEFRGATGLVDRALLIANDPKIKALFIDLKAALPPLSPVIPPATPATPAPKKR
jgi:hypothetical protein